MAIIVAGKLQLKPGARQEFIEKSCDAIRQARALAACEDFSVSPDPIDENRSEHFREMACSRAIRAVQKCGSRE